MFISPVFLGLSQCLCVCVGVRVCVCLFMCYKSFFNIPLTFASLSLGVDSREGTCAHKCIPVLLALSTADSCLAKMEYHYSMSSLLV